MNIENPGRTPTEEKVRAIEEEMRAFVAEHPEEYGKLNLSPEEIRIAATLMGTRGGGKEMIPSALDARISVRGSEKILVSDNQGVVIGAAGSSSEARKIARQENETRDLG